MGEWQPVYVYSVGRDPPRFWLRNHLVAQALQALQVPQDQGRGTARMANRAIPSKPNPAKIASRVERSYRYNLYSKLMELLGREIDIETRG